MPRRRIGASAIRRRDGELKMSRNGDGGSRNSKRKIQDAARNLERAVEALAAAASEEVSSGAAKLLDEAAARVRGESRTRGQRQSETETGSERERSTGRRRSRRIHYRDYQDLPRRSRRLYLDRENRKIVGVCGGIARYLGIESWVARCAALTGLFFLPSIVFPAYWIAFFVMGRAPSDHGSDHGKVFRSVGRRAKHGQEARRCADEKRRAARQGRRSGDKNDHHSPAPEFGAKFAPRQSLRAAQADLAEVELRLRRIEAFVTSDRYALECGFAEIDANATAKSSPSTETPRPATGQD